MLNYLLNHRWKLNWVRNDRVKHEGWKKVGSYESNSTLVTSLNRKTIVKDEENDAAADLKGGPWRAWTAGPNVRFNVWFSIGDLMWAATASSNGWQKCSPAPTLGSRGSMVSTTWPVWNHKIRSWAAMLKQNAERMNDRNAKYKTVQMIATDHWHLFVRIGTESIITMQHSREKKTTRENFKQYCS